MSDKEIRDTITALWELGRRSSWDFLQAKNAAEICPEEFHAIVRWISANREDYQALRRELQLRFWG